MVVGHQKYLCVLLWMLYSTKLSLFKVPLSPLETTVCVFSLLGVFLLFAWCAPSSPGWTWSVSVHFLPVIASPFIRSCLVLSLSPQPVEGANEFLQLLKSHKEKLEEGMRELRRKNEELEKEREEGEKERERMRRCNDQLRAKLAQAQVTPLIQTCTNSENQCSDVVLQVSRKYQQ